MNTIPRLAALAVTLVAMGAGAQAFPAKPVHVVVPFAPGGNLDVTARIFADAMGKELGQTFVVENKPGAGGVLGQEIVAHAAPDGYTLVIATSGTTVVSPLLVGGKPPYQLSDFTCIGLMAVTPLLLEVPAASRYRDVGSFIADVRANPGKVSIGHSGNGTTNHIAILLLQDALKLDFNIVPYKGSGPMLVDLVGGQIQSGMDQTSSSLAQVQGGKLRALAVATRKRIADLPNVPTLDESGAPGFEAVTPSGLLAPAGTPPEVVKILNAAVNHALADTAIQKKLHDLASEIQPMSPAEYTQFMLKEEARLKALNARGVLKGS
ncbi:MAG TPA: tripartite tricarboxylate transporter substrate binding protein [Usitatibacter sp.]|jgi:tripartite-type tricarboxylate transporter receptor subunit TctC|nr:tripartite tricarboxylate transporter substrate binding protein [Usitatibacter sp.]